MTHAHLSKHECIVPVTEVKPRRKPAQKRLSFQGNLICAIHHWTSLSSIVYRFEDYATRCAPVGYTTRDLIYMLNDQAVACLRG
jgi:hypothetical protein